MDTVKTLAHPAALDYPQCVKHRRKFDAEKGCPMSPQIIKHYPCLDHGFAE
jgi:hypothetical protein